MKWYAIINDGIFLAIGCGNSCEPETEITETEYNKLFSIIHKRPIPPDGYDYKLKADTLEWELVELPEPSDTDEDATESDYIEALQDLGVEVDA